jgi:hypothetical protein
VLAAGEISDQSWHVLFRHDVYRLLLVAYNLGRERERPNTVRRSSRAGKVAAKATWEVQAGVIPGTPMADNAKVTAAGASCRARASGPARYRCD